MEGLGCRRRIYFSSKFTDATEAPGTVALETTVREEQCCSYLGRQSFYCPVPKNCSNFSVPLFQSGHDAESLGRILGISGPLRKEEQMEERKLLPSDMCEINMLKSLS